MKTKRMTCPQCGFLEVRCLCQYLEKVNNKTKVIVLQHPSESKHAIGTLQIIDKSLQNLIIYRGETFHDNQELINLIENESECSALVYPNESRSEIKTIPLSSIKNIILIDGSWRKVRKILFMNPWLNQLPQISLQSPLKSQYKIRKSSQNSGLSTLEAVVECLKLLEPNLETSSLVKSFSAMIDFQIEKMGKEKFRQNYKKGDE